MRVEKVKDGRCLATFWLFGVELEKEFQSEEEAEVFFENLRSTYVTKLASIGECIDRYVQTVSIKKSLNSKKWEAYIFKSLCEFLSLNNISKDSPVTKIELSHLEDFQQWLVRTKNISPATVNRYFNTLKHFFNKLVQWECLVKSPAKYLKRLKETPKQKETWRNSDFLAVLNVLCPEDQLMLWFLKFTGARISTATKVKIGDINFSSGTVSLVTQKGPRAEVKVYYFPLHDKLRKLIKKLIDIHPTKNPKHFLLLNKNHRAVHPNYYSRRIQKALAKKEVIANTGVRKLSLHGLRHTLATEMHAKGMTLNEVKNLLGHSSVTVTQGYLHADPSEMLRKMNLIA